VEEERTGPEVLLWADSMPHRVSLEDRVAYRWLGAGDVLAGRHGARRDRLVLTWLAGAVAVADRPATVLDVGCAYGNHLFMLNAFLDKPPDVTFVGVDLFAGAIEFARAFAREVRGYERCRFAVADVARGLPFDDATFDAINCADVIEHLERPGDALAEMQRVAKPGATVAISTPLRASVFKRLAEFANGLSRGRIHERYYAGKGVALDSTGRPRMDAPAGHAHVSEMTYSELVALVERSGFRIEEAEPMSVMSGSAWFDEHPLLLSGLLLLEAVHELARRPSWAHSVMLRLRVPDGA
jgi:SAM-dependent methyltransferase